MSKAKTPAQPAKSQAPPAPVKGAFNPKDYAKNGISEDEVIVVKQAFDLFDTDQGGSVDIKGIFGFTCRTQGCYDLTRIRVQERNHFPDDF